MSTRQVRDMCGLSCVAQFADHAGAELFVYLIGTGASRSLYELTAHDRRTHTLLFDMQVEASAPALESRALAAGTGADAQAVSVAFEHARRIIDAKAYEQSRRYRLVVEAASETLHPITAS